MKDRYTLPVMLLVFVVLAAGIVAAGGLLYRSQRDSCRTEAEHNLTAVADLKVSELSAWPAPMSPVTRKSFHYDWHWFWNYGNGEIGNNNVHVVDTTRLILGLSGLGRGVISSPSTPPHPANAS